MTLLFKSIDGKTYTLANVRGPKGTLIVAVLGVTPGVLFVSTPPDAHEASRLSGTVSAGARWRVSGFAVRRRRPNSSTQK